MRNKEIISREMRLLLKKVRANNYTQKDKVDFGIVTNTHASKILKQTGVNIYGYRRVVFADEIKHILKNHGAGKEKRENQIHVNFIDIINLPNFFVNSHITISKSKDGLIALKHQQDLKYYQIIIEVVRTGRRQLALKTMYKKRKY